MTGLSPCSRSTWLPLTVSPLRRTTMTFGPPEVWATLLLTSIVPSAQFVLVTVPAVESIVVVPEVLQFHVGDVAKVHCVASTLTDGGIIVVAQAQVPPVQEPLAQSELPPHVSPVPQGEQEPPQSTSLSSPSLTWLPQVDVFGAHVPALHVSPEPQLQVMLLLQPSLI